jgi:hypothetical protein
MPAGYQTNQDTIDHFLLSDDDFSDFRTNLIKP